MNFTDAIESGLKNWIRFSGRASRSEYWFYTLFFYIYVIVEQMMNSELMKLLLLNHHHGGLALLCALGTLILLFGTTWIAIGQLSVFVRRMHDVNRSGWWYWIAFTLIGAIYPLLVWQCTKGTEGENRFGPDPLLKDPV